MSTVQPRILVVDDDPDIIKAARLLLERRGMAVAGAAHPDAAWAQIADAAPDVILLDLNFARGQVSGAEGFAMLDRLLAADARAVVIVVTGHSGVAAAVQAMRGGASDFVVKPWNNERLLATVERGVALRRARMASAPMVPTGDDLMLGNCPAIVAACALLARVAPTDAALLVRGEPGTGKTLLARLAHRRSARGERPLVVLDAATADAVSLDRAVSAAVGATLLIEEVERLPAPLQPELARRGEGVRLLATSRLPRAALRDALAADLLYRLNTIELDLPPLRTRGDDVLLLARHYLDLFAARHARPARPLSDEAARAVAADAWPDNVRGLRQAAERAVLLGDGAAHAAADFALLAAEDDAPTPRASFNLAASEEALVTAALKRHGFNVSRAAAELGLTRAALYRRMARYGL